MLLPLIECYAGAKPTFSVSITDSGNKKGLYLMDSPGHDAESVTGLVSRGAPVVLFSTGRGTPTVFPIAPVVKITGNHNTFERMKADIDFAASPVINSSKSIRETGEALLVQLRQILCGKLTKAEQKKAHELFVINKSANIFLGKKFCPDVIIIVEK